MAANDDTGIAGWDAINAALARLYPGQAPRHYGTGLSHTLGGMTLSMGSASIGTPRRDRIGTTSATACPSCTTSRVMTRRKAALALN